VCVCWKVGTGEEVLCFVVCVCVGGVMCVCVGTWGEGVMCVSLFLCVCLCVYVLTWGSCC
jgi:hypothetical protein